MTPDEYFRSVLAKYSVNINGAKAAGQAIYPVLARWGSGYLTSADFSGSLAKGTGVSLSTDADIFLSLDPATPGNLAQLYQTLYNAVVAAGYPARKQEVSIGTKVNGYSIDLVPGRRQSLMGSDHSLHRNKGQTWTQTNVEKHIAYVRNSNRLEEIRILKIWRALNRVEFPSFYLELATIDGLQGARFGNLATNVLIALGHFKKNIQSVRYVDPANTNNIVSDDCTDAEKAAIAIQAGRAYGATNWSEIAS